MYNMFNLSTPKVNNEIIQSYYNSFMSELRFIQLEVPRTEAIIQSIQKLDACLLNRYTVRISIYGLHIPVKVYFSDILSYNRLKAYPLLMGICDNKTINVYPVSNVTWNIEKCNLDKIVKDVSNSGGLIIGSRSKYFAFLVDDDIKGNTQPLDYYSYSYFDNVRGLGKYTLISNITNIEIIDVDSHSNCLVDSGYSKAMINYVNDNIKSEVNSIKEQNYNILSQFFGRYRYIFDSREFNLYRNNIHELLPSLITKEKFAEYYTKSLRG